MADALISELHIYITRRRARTTERKHALLSVLLTLIHAQTEMVTVTVAARCAP